jgi:adenylate cyclase
MKKNAQYKYLVPAGIAVLFVVLALTGLTAGLEFRVLDGFLALRQSPPEDPRIVLVDVDDPAISTIGTWPISRSITANGLMLLAELGAKQATFDIEYTDKSPRGVNSDILEQDIPQLIDSELGRLQGSIKDLFDAVAKGQLSARDAVVYVDDLVGIAGQAKEGIKASINNIALDNDQYLAEAARFFGKAYFTINMRRAPELNITMDLRQEAMTLHGLKNIEDKGSVITPALDILPVLSPVIEEAEGLGFTNAEADNDGIRRRILLVQKYGDTWFGQLVFRPLLDLLENPTVTVYRNKVVLGGAKMQDGSTADISIPVGNDGKTILDWPHKTFDKSFKHVSFEQLYLHDQQYSNLVHNVRLGESGNWFHGYQGEVPLLELVRQSTELRAAIMAGTESPTLVPQYAALRARFLSELGAFLDTKPEEAIKTDIEAILANPAVDDATRGELKALLVTIPDFFQKTRGIHQIVMKYRDDLKVLEGSFCIIGQTNTGSTDLGANPFAKAYPNIGTHASLVNMILNDKFIVELSPLWSFLLALAGSLGLSVLTRTMKSSWSIALGVGISVGIVVLAGVFFVASGMYLPIIPLAGPILLSFITVTFIKFFVTEKEKGFLRSAFSHYLSADVIKQIIANPDKLRLGGEQKLMTAMFTDIKGFSTVSEKMSPTELVALLNQYLTGMSDIVLEMGGTIDKYEGDAIIAFFGAPLDLVDHASRALKAAVAMKNMETQLNTHFLAEKLAPGPLLTRFGINTGQMVVGNMGTEKKMDYTIIGDSVNLAARLEGVNKRYGTWICVSEDTVNAAGTGFVFRKLDRIRVVGKAVPIRIFELVGEESRVSDENLKALEQFEFGLDLFDQRNWVAAINKFSAALDFVPEDGPSQRFIKTCKEYMVKPPSESWDGVYVMDVK